MDETITAVVSALVTIAAALGGLRGYDKWMEKRRRSVESEKTDSPADRHRSLMMAIGRQQEHAAEALDLLKGAAQEIESIERQLELVRERLRAVEQGVEILRDRRSRDS